MRVALSKEKSRAIMFIVGISGVSLMAFPLASDIYISAKLQMLLIFVASMTFFGISKKVWNEIVNEKVLLLFIFSFISTFGVFGWFGSANTFRFLWGETGRGNGFLTYLILSFFLLGIRFTYNYLDSQYLIRGFLFFFFFSVLYFYAQHAGLNVFHESYVYNNMVGYFGNPDFTSAFLGMIFTISLGTIFFFNIWRPLGFLLANISLYEILLTGALQGFLIAGVAVAYYIYIFGIRRGVSFKFRTLYISTLIGLTGIGILGFLGSGPLGRYLERGSFRIRIGYFESAIKMFKSDPLLGVGVDSYGDYFRQFRPDWLISIIGDGTTSNDAHNIYLNILSTTGIFTFLAFLILNLYCIFRGMKALKSNPSNSMLIISFGVVLVFEIQSLISINNIGLSIWGWLFMGIVFAISSRSESGATNLNKKQFNKNNRFLILLISGSLTFLTIPGFIRIHESLKLKAAASSINNEASQQYKEHKFTELAGVSAYWIPDVVSSMIIQESLLTLGASEAAETVSKATYLQNPNSRDALWALVAIETRRGKFNNAIQLREKLILKENGSWWVLLDQAESYVSIKNVEKAEEYLNLAKKKPDVDLNRLKAIQARIDAIK